jgi:ribose 5-phosphate isomerase B
MTAVRVAIASDHGGFELKEDLKAWLQEQGHAVVDLGPADTQAVDYPDFAVRAAVAVAAGLVDRAVMIDGAGIGSCMAANKVAGVRAAMCYDLSTAANAREHNDANLLTLGGGLIGKNLARQILRIFLETAFAGGRHARRVEKINALDRGEAS